MQEYKEYYEKEGEIKSYPKDNYYYESIFSLVPNEEMNSVLDVGCGEGYICSKLNGIGLDLSMKKLTSAKKNFPDTILLQGSIYKLPFKDGTFDLVTAIEMLEHLEEPEKAIKELSRVAKKYLLIQVPYNEIIRAEICPNCLKSMHPRGHLQSFDEERLQTLCRENGLEVLKMDAFFHGFNHKLIRWMPKFLLKPIKWWVFKSLMKHGGYIGALCTSRTS